MTLIQMLNAVLEQSGFLSRSSFTNSVDPDDKQMVAIANRVAYEIMNFYDWGELRKSHTVNLVTGTESYDMPADYQSFVPDSAWESEGERKVDLPVNNKDWWMYKFTAFSDGGTIRGQFYGNTIQIFDATDNETFSFEYISKYPIANSKEFFTDDSDTWLLDDQLLILGVQAHWMQTKLMPQYIEHMQNYRAKMAEAISRSAGGQTIGGIPARPNRSPYTPLYVK